MREVDCPAPDPVAAPHSPGYGRELGEKKDSASRDEEVEAVLNDGDEFSGILLFPGEVPLPAHAHTSNHTPIHKLSQPLNHSHILSLISLALALTLTLTLTHTQSNAQCPTQTRTHSKCEHTWIHTQTRAHTHAHTHWENA